jgi:hypothetical protein
MRHRMVLEIGLVSGRAVSIVFWDSGFLSRGARGMPPMPITDPSALSALWHQILERRAVARHGRSSPSA